MSRFLYLVRHGEQQDAEHGLPDGPLSSRGVRQAKALAERLGGVPFDGAWTSPLQRAQETARIMTERLPALEPDVDRVLVVGSTDRGALRDVPGLSVEAFAPDGTPVARYDVTDAAGETAMVLAELYRRAGGWKFRAVGQGWANGLEGLATDHGRLQGPQRPARRVRIRRDQHGHRLALGVPAQADGVAGPLGLADEGPSANGPGQGGRRQGERGARGGEGEETSAIHGFGSWKVRT